MPVCLHRLYTPSKGNDMFFFLAESHGKPAHQAPNGEDGYVATIIATREGGSRRYCSTAFEDHESGMIKQSVFCPIDRIHHPSFI